MGATTGIEWAHATWNPWRGCRKVSQGCKNCYMFREQTFYGRDPNVVVRTTPATFNAPLRWQRAWARGERDPKKALAPGSRIFSCSWSDWFIEEADEWRAEAWRIIEATPEYAYLILTKRPERILDHLPPGWGEGWPNVWLGVSAERQQEAEERLTWLLDVPAAVRFVSAEPLLGPISLSALMIEHNYTVNCLTGREDTFLGPEKIWGRIHWVITGGESDRENPRSCDPAWVRAIRDQCAAAGAAFFHKQNGGSRKIDGAWGGRLLDGRTWDEFPVYESRKEAQ